MAVAVALVLLAALVVVWRRGGGPGGGEVSSTTSWPTTSAAREAFPTVPSTAPPAKSEPPSTPTSVTTPPVGQFPDAASTGVPEGTSLVSVPSSRYWLLDHDLDGVEFTGMIVVNKPNITIRNSRIVASEAVAGIWNRNSHAGLVIENVDIVCTAVPPTGAGVAGANMVVQSSDISGCADGIKAGPGSVIAGNYIHDLGFGEKTHNDGIQIGDGEGVEIRGNSIVQVDNGSRQANAAVFVQDTYDPVSGVSIVGNYVNGFGFTLRLSGRRITNSTIAGNVIGPDHLFGPLLLDRGAEDAANGNSAVDNVRPDGTPID